jgi:hypothetical protein
VRRSILRYELIRSVVVECCLSTERSVEVKLAVAASILVLTQKYSNFNVF